MTLLKSNITKILFIFVLLCESISCQRETVILPNVPVNYEIALIPDLSNLGNEQVMILPFNANYSNGVGGLLIYRRDITEFYAFDRACPNEKTAEAAVTLDTSKTVATCPICGSQFLFSDLGCQTMKGPSPYPLKEYHTTVQGGNYLDISN